MKKKMSGAAYLRKLQKEALLATSAFAAKAAPALKEFILSSCEGVARKGGNIADVNINEAGISWVCGVIRPLDLMDAAIRLVAASLREEGLYIVQMSSYVYSFRW